MRLFVDCDDTLVLWLDDEGDALVGPNPWGPEGHPDRWKPNDELIAVLDEWRAEGPSGLEIILWSGGGTDYAQLWQRRIYPAADDAISKNTRIPTLTDLCIDDMPIKVACGVVTWQEFVERGDDDADHQTAVGTLHDEG